MPTVLIVGASRGIGRELVRQYAADGWSVIAGCRNPNDADFGISASTASIKIVELDTTSAGSIDRCRTTIECPLDVLIVAAGVYGGEGQTFGSIDYDELRRTLDVNTAGPVRVAEAFASNLQAAPSSKLVALTSQMGSIDQTDASTMMAYRISKAALNEAWKCISIDMAPRGVTAMVIHPGWVSTDMGGSDAPVTPEDSARGIREVIGGLTPTDAGTFRTFEGATLPW